MTGRWPRTGVSVHRHDSHKFHGRKVLDRFWEWDTDICLPESGWCWAPEQASGMWGRAMVSPLAWAGATTSMGWAVCLQSGSLPPPLSDTHHTKVSLLVPGLPSLPDCGIPKDSDLVLFICGAPVPVIGPGSWWALNKCLLKE